MYLEVALAESDTQCKSASEILLVVVEDSILTTKSTDKSATFEGIISKLYKIQGTNMIKATTIGNNTVQQNNIS